MEPHVYMQADYERSPEMLEKMTEGGVVLFP